MKFLYEKWNFSLGQIYLEKKICNCVIAVHVAFNARNFILFLFCFIFILLIACLVTKIFVKTLFWDFVTAITNESVTAVTRKQFQILSKQGWQEENINLYNGETYLHSQDADDKVV